MTPHLFVYGTLMMGARGALGTAQRARLGREARSLGAATLRGALHDMGEYPGFVECEAGGVVHGEVLLLTSPAETLAWLDEYEGVYEGAPERSDYARRQYEVALASGETLMAWVYVYLGDTTRARRIESGRWVARGLPQK